MFKDRSFFTAFKKVTSQRVLFLVTAMKQWQFYGFFFNWLQLLEIFGPPLAHGDPAPLGPKERKLKREELVFYQFISSWSKSQSINRV